MDLDQRFANYVAKRYGVITRTQARSLGNTDSAIDRRIKQALWIPIFREVYRVAAVPRSFEQGVLAATIAARGAAAMRTALRMHGIHGYQGNIVEILSSTTRRPRSGIFRFHHTDRLPHSDIVHIGCIPVTTATRTLVDLGASLPAKQVEVALDSALRQGKTSLDAL